MKNQDFLQKLGISIIEAAPIGSFGYIAQKLSYALNAMDSFDPDGDGDNDKYCSYITAIYPDRCIIECGESFFEMTYAIDKDGKVTFGDPTEVEQYFTATESTTYRAKTVAQSPLEKELKECGFEITKVATDVDFDEKIGTINARIKEGSFNATTGTVDIIIIEAGTNELKKRHYPVSTIKESANIFKGMKMYLNHQTEREERERPERDVRDWVSTIQESSFSPTGAGLVQGKACIHDKQLRENMTDPIYAANIGLSINTGGRVSYGKINGEEMQIVEKIHPNRSNGPGSVDWVTEAGARGRVAQPLKESASHNGEKDMDLSKLTMDELKDKNPTLYKQIQENATQKSAEEKLAEANRIIEETRKEAKLLKQQELLKKLLKESKLADVVRERISDDFKETIFETEDALKETLKKRIEKELAYVNSLSEKGRVKVGASGSDHNRDNEPLQESQKALEGRFGIKS